MRFNEHTKLTGTHAVLSASNYHWINYDDDKMDAVYTAIQAARRGTELHEFAHHAIRLKQKLPRSTKTLNQYVNDAIGFRMRSEQVLFYSINCYGTVDAISFRNNVLRIHDLKTGTNPASFSQLLVYMALFCLEYNKNPFMIEAELRIYQNDEFKVLTPDADDIIHIMEKIKSFDKRIEQMKEEDNPW